MKINKLIVFMVVLILLTLPIAFSDNYPTYVRPKIAGVLQASTLFNYNFIFSNESSCSSIFLNSSAAITTDDYGIGFSNLNLTTLTTPPSYQCEYRDGSLRATHEFGVGIFSRLLVPGNVIVGGNITGNILESVCASILIYLVN